jgi:triosephosphate isomerase
MTRIPLMAGNWKMNLDHLEAAATVQRLHWALQDANFSYDKVEVRSCRPSPICVRSRP